MKNGELPTQHRHSTYFEASLVEIARGAKSSILSEVETAI